MKKIKKLFLNRGSRPIIQNQKLAHSIACMALVLINIFCVPEIAKADTQWGTATLSNDSDDEGPKEVNVTANGENTDVWDKWVIVDYGPNKTLTVPNNCKKVNTGTNAGVGFSLSAHPDFPDIPAETNGGDYENFVHTHNGSNVPGELCLNENGKLNLDGMGYDNVTWAKGKGPIPVKVNPGDTFEIDGKITYNTTLDPPPPLPTTQYNILLKYQKLGKYQDTVKHYLTGLDGGDFLLQESKAKILETTDVTFSKSLYSPWDPGAVPLHGLGSKFIQKDYFTYDYESGEHYFPKTIEQPGKKVNANYYYEPNKYNINYVLNGGTNSPNNPSEYTVLKGVKLEDPTKPGCIFMGWTTTSELINDSNKVSGINLDSSGNPLGSSFSSLEDLNSKVSTRTFGDITFYAHWGYNVHFELDGGDNLNLYNYVEPFEVDAKVPAEGELNSTNFDGDENKEGTQRAGFTLKGWELTNMDTTTHEASLDSLMRRQYTDLNNSSTWNWQPNGMRRAVSNFSVPDSYFRRLSNSTPDIYFETVWKDETPPILSLVYTNDLNSNTDIYPENAPSKTYAPGSWTSKTVDLEVTAADGGAEGKAGGTGFPNMPWFDSEPIVSNSGYSLSYSGDQPTVKTARTFADSTSINGVSGTVRATDNAGTANTTKGPGQRRWWSTSNHTETAAYGAIKIDKIKPTASMTYTWYDITENNGAGKEVTKDAMDTFTNGNVTLTIKANDTLSGIKGKAFCRIEGNESTNYAAKLKVASNWVPATSGTTFVTVVTKNETGRIYVRDAVGNYTYIPYNVQGIDRKAPFEEEDDDSDDGSDNPPMQNTDKSNEITIDWINKNVRFTVKSEDIEDSLNAASGIFMMRLYETTCDYPTERKALNAIEYDVLDKSKSHLLDEDDGAYLTNTANGKEITYTETKEGMNFLVIETIDRAGNVTNTYLTIKIDKTYPGIPNGSIGISNASSAIFHGNSNKENFVSGEYWKIVPVDLEKVDVDKIENFIKNEDNMMTKFYFTFFDRNFSNNYAYHSDRNIDDSGYAKVTLEIYDTDTITRNENGDIVTNANTVGIPYVLYDYADPTAVTRTSRVAPTGRTYKTSIDTSVNSYEWDVRDKLLNTTYLTNQSFTSFSLKAKINTMADFPGAAMLAYRIVIEDRAGNQKIMCNHPGNDILNFAIRSVIRSGEDEKFDTDYEISKVVYDYNNHFLASDKKFASILPYFQLGDRGYIEVWTVGYVPRIQPNFGNAVDLMREGNISIGEEMIKEIKESRIPLKYNLGTYAGGTDPSFYRLVQYEKGEKLTVSYANDIGGVPFANHYGRKEKANYALEKSDYNVGWLSDGVAVRMPIYYALTELVGDDGKVETNADGTPKYASEMHQAATYAWKKSTNNSSAPYRKNDSKTLYVIWDTNSNDLHYRVTH